jgi:7,8-dihydropterin-6-yl-methyl-4-(beta-D-ribofuranosyl)aminobenzene 5'-phosphate synthase
MMFDAGPEEDMWERNANRLGIDLASIELIQLSHWHRDHSGGLLRAIEMITQAKTVSPSTNPPVVVDLHPSRPDYRGFMMGETPISMEADPSFEEIATKGGKIERSSVAHTVLDDMFLVSGEIPSVTGYEKGIRNGIRFQEQTGKWEKDEEIMDERFLMCNLKGVFIYLPKTQSH